MVKIAVDERLRDGDKRKQVRLAWCLAGGGPDADEKVARDFGISVTCMRIWRRDKEPDGQDWEQFRIELSLASHDAQIAMLGQQDEVLVHAEIIAGAQRILGAVRAALNEGVLYDGPPPKAGVKDTRQVVAQLWAQDGAVVPVGPLRPKSAAEAVRMLQGLSATLDGSYKRVEHLLAMRGDAQKVEDEIFTLCCTIVNELWGEEAMQEFCAAARAKGEKGPEPKAIVVPFTAVDVSGDDPEETNDVQ
jgi:hypothetical protein